MSMNRLLRSAGNNLKENTNLENSFLRKIDVGKLNSSNLTEKRAYTLNHNQSSPLVDTPNSHRSNLLQNEDNIKINSDTNSDDNIVFIKELNEMDEFFIKQTLINHFMFTNDELIQIILDDLIEIKIKKGKILYEQNDEGEYFYMVKSGLFETTGPNSTTFDRFYKPWECFGDLSLIQNSPRLETVRAAENSEVYLLQGSLFREIITKINEMKLKERLEYIRKVPFFLCLNNAEKHNIANLLKIESFHCRETIIKQGENGDKMYIIKEGCVSCRFNTSEIRILYEKDFFGQNSIIFDDNNRSINIVSLSKTTCYVLSKETLVEGLGANYKKPILFGIFYSFISKSKFFSETVSSSQINSLFENFKLVLYKHGDVLYNQEKDKQKIVFLIEGNLVKFETNKNEKLELITKRGDIFGEEFLKSMKIKKNLRDITKNSTKNLAEKDSEFYDNNVLTTHPIKDVSITSPNSSLPILAYTECISFESTWEKTIDILEIQSEDKPFDVLSRINRLKNIMIFKNLSKKKLMMLAKLMQRRKYRKDDIIIEENTSGEEFYMLTKGSVRITQNDVVLRECEEGSCFGELSIINNESRTATVTAIKSAICYVLIKSDFDRIIDREIRENLKLPCKTHQLL